MREESLTAAVATPARGARQRRTWKPSAALRPHVASYELHNVRLGATRIFNPLPARTDCFLQFYLTQPYWVIAVSTGEVHRAPSRVLVGPRTRRTEDLIWTGDLKAFTIRFSPIGFRSVFGIPAAAIRELATDAELIWGSAIRTLEARLAEAEDHRMPLIAEEFLLAHLTRQPARGNSPAVLRMSAAIESPAGAAGLCRIASMHNLGLRQMERLFQEFVGVSPKVFERLCRAKQALALHRARPDLDWASIAASSGYFDQAHLIREFRSLNGATPLSFALGSRQADEFRGGSAGLPDGPTAMSHLYNRHVDPPRYS